MSLDGTIWPHERRGSSRIVHKKRMATTVTWENAGGQGRDRTGDLPLFRWKHLRHNGIHAGHRGAIAPDRTGWNTWTEPLAPSWPHAHEAGTSGQEHERVDVARPNDREMPQI